MKSLHFYLICLTMIVAAAAMAGCLDDDNGDGDNGGNGGSGAKITINGVEFLLKDIFKDYGSRTVNSDGSTLTGTPLDALINATNLTTPENWQYKITAGDGFYRNVTWTDLTKGVLVEDETKTAFSNLPKGYQVREVEKIEKITTDLLVFADRTYTWDQPFAIFKWDMKDHVEDANTTHTGVVLWDLANFTGISDAENATFRVTASDGYNKSVAGENFTKGLLVKGEMKVVFPDLAKSFWVRDVVTIEII